MQVRDVVLTSHPFVHQANNDVPVQEGEGRKQVSREKTSRCFDRLRLTGLAFRLLRPGL